MPEDDSKKSGNVDDNNSEVGRHAETIQFQYIKSNLFRVIHADGVIGGPAPRNQLYINFYSERLAIPQQQTYELKPNRTLGKEIESARISRGGVVREVEAAVVFDIRSAHALHQWLGERLKEFDNAKKQQGEGLSQQTRDKEPDGVH
jgi:hypothetical protein